jgi:hypothetical protein
MPKAINQPPPNADEIVVDFSPDETPGPITVEGDGTNLWLMHNGKAFARRENGLWLNFTDN